MRLILIAACVVVAACQPTRKNKRPEGRTVVSAPHPEYHEIRPVAIAVLPVVAPRLDLRREIRRRLAKELIEMRYSPLRLDVVDAHIGGDGRIAGELEWDASLEVRISKWVGAGVDAFAATGVARLTHKSGELLWKCEFFDEVFPVEESPGAADYEPAARKIAAHVVRRMPERAE